MIKFQDVTKYFPIETRKLHRSYYLLFKELNFTFESGKRYAIMGRNGTGKSSLINMVSGLIMPTSGKIIKNVKVSWPVGYGGAFNGSLTALENINFVTKIYGMNDEQRQKALNFCQEFADIGEHFYLPIKTYSSGMKARISFAVSMACDFDCYLLDEVTATGDTFFSQKAKNFLKDKLIKKDFIFVSHKIGEIRDLCDRFGVIYNKRIEFFDNFKEANKFYDRINTK